MVKPLMLTENVASNIVYSGLYYVCVYVLFVWGLAGADNGLNQSPQIIKALPNLL